MKKVNMKKFAACLVLYISAILNICINASAEEKVKFDSIVENRNSFFLHKDNFEEENHTLYFNPATEIFVRDAEYFLPYTKGYTALGFYFDPTLSYKINEKARIEVGVHLMGIAGDRENDVRDVSPIVRLEYRPTEWLRIVGGSLYGNLNHNLYEPMYDCERYLYANQETGLQAFADTKYWEGEMWCNWEQFIVPDDDFQEKFTFGWRNEFHTAESKAYRLSIPLHLMANHRGGQFTSLKDTCLETLMNVATGIKVDWIGNKIGFTAEIPVFGFFNRSDKSHIHTHFKDGWGVYPMLSLQNLNEKNRFLVNVGYWLGDSFISGRGSYHFQSRSYFDETYERKDRHMVTGKFCYGHKYKGIELGFDFQGYYDLDEKNIDYAAGIFLRYTDLFKIHSWEKD